MECPEKKKSHSVFRKFISLLTTYWVETEAKRQNRRSQKRRSLNQRLKSPRLHLTDSQPWRTETSLMRVTCRRCLREIWSWCWSSWRLTQSSTNRNWPRNGLWRTCHDLYEQLFNFTLVCQQYSMPNGYSCIGTSQSRMPIVFDHLCIITISRCAKHKFIIDLVSMGKHA